MNTKTKSIRIYIPILWMIILVTSALRCAALLLNFNPESNYFDEKGIITAAGIILAICSVILFTYAFTAPKSMNLIASFSTPETYIPTGAVCTALSVFVMHGFIKIRDMELHLSDIFSSGDLGKIVLVISIILGILSIVHFVLTALLTERESISRAVFGLANVLFLALYTCYLYFDTSLQMNAPNKIVDQMAFLFAALFFLYEVRISLKREVWNFYIAFGFIAAALTAYSSIPSIIYYFADGAEVSNSIYENLLSFCIFIFIISRIILASHLKEDKESEFIEFIKEYSAERDAAVGEVNNETLEAYAELFGNGETAEETPEENNEEIAPPEEEDLIEIVSAEEPTPASVSTENESAKESEEISEDTVSEKDI